MVGNRQRFINKSSWTMEDLRRAVYLLNEMFICDIAAAKKLLINLYKKDGNTNSWKYFKKLVEMQFLQTIKKTKLRPTL